MAPFLKTGLFGDQVSYIIAFFIGISFGFWLERAGFGSSRKLAAQFYFTDMTVLKVMFTAIITAMTGLLFFSLFGWIDLSLVYINPTYLWPQIIGGLILGVGFVIGGYCPGTSIVAASTGKIDGFFFIGGAMAGMFVFGETYSWISDFHKSGAMGTVLVSDWLNISMGLVGFLIILMALLMFWGGEWLEKKFNSREVAS
jgi:uncharacterized membrane protein YedE/YeeE